MPLLTAGKYVEHNSRHPGFFVVARFGRMNSTLQCLLLRGGIHSARPAKLSYYPVFNEVDNMMCPEAGQFS